MDIRDYCDSMYAELTGMKARLYDILRVIERITINRPISRCIDHRGIGPAVKPPKGVHMLMAHFHLDH